MTAKHAGQREWSPGELKDVARLLAAGLNYPAIAAHLNQTYGTNRTRLAVRDTIIRRELDTRTPMGRQPGDQLWRPNHVRRLDQLLQAGQSYAAAAAILNNEHGTRRTTASVRDFIYRRSGADAAAKARRPVSLPGCPEYVSRVLAARPGGFPVAANLTPVRTMRAYG